MSHLPPPPPPHDTKKKPWWKRWWVITIIVLFVLSGIGGAIDNDGSTTQQAQETQEVEPEPEPEPAPQRNSSGDLGTNARFDALAGRCDAGSAEACEELFLNSPAGSEYESYAIERMFPDDLAEPPTTTEDFDDEFARLAFEIVWANLTRDDQRDVCIYYNAVGPQTVYDEHWRGSGASLQQMSEFFGDVCS